MLNLRTDAKAQGAQCRLLPVSHVPLGLTALRVAAADLGNGRHLSSDVHDVQQLLVLRRRRRVPACIQDPRGSFTVSGQRPDLRALRMTCSICNFRSIAAGSPPATTLDCKLEWETYNAQLGWQPLQAPRNCAVAGLHC